MTLALPEVCDRAAVEALLPELRERCGSGPFTIDASATSRPGHALLQVLVAARKSAPGTRIVPSAALIDAAALTGLGGELFDEGDA